MRPRVFHLVAVFAVCLLPILACNALAQDQHGHGHAPATQADPATMPPDVKAHPSCPLCGMDRGKFAHSRMLLEYEDGSSYGACSLHCAVLDMAVNLDKAPAKIMVGDYSTKKLIDAEKATWVIGGDQMGVMSKRGKWAFEDKAAAEAFIKQHGGQLADFDAVIKAAFDDMASDTMMIRERRKAMKMKMKQPS